MDKQEKESYFEQVFDTYAKDIFRYAYSKISSHATAEDVTSDVFVKFWNKLTQDQHILNERAILYTIAHGLIIDEYRKHNRSSVSIDVVDPAFFGRDDNTEQAIDTKKDIEDMFGKMKELKKEYQDVLQLHYIEEIDISEIAEIIKKKEGTVRVLVHRALSALKKLYE